MKDPFEFGKVEKLGAGQGAPHAAPLSTSGGAARSAEASAAKAASQQDHVLLSDEVEGAEGSSFGGAVNFGAWSAQGQALETGPSGLQPAAVYGPDGVSGLEPGMQAGGVHKASEPLDL